MLKPRLSHPFTTRELKPRRVGTLSPAYGATKKPELPEVEQLLDYARGKADAGDDL